MGCNHRFSESGNFCCPYHVYKLLTTKTFQLRDKAMLAKKDLELCDYGFVILRTGKYRSKPI